DRRHQRGVVQGQIEQLSLELENADLVPRDAVRGNLVPEFLWSAVVLEVHGCKRRLLRRCQARVSYQIVKARHRAGRGCGLEVGVGKLLKARLRRGDVRGIEVDDASLDGFVQRILDRLETRSGEGVLLGGEAGAK